MLENISSIAQFTMSDEEMPFLKQKKSFNLTSEEVGRISQISFVLEPIAEKPGLTTRTKDLNSNLKLENFLVAGINVGDAFRKLAERIYENNNLPITYDLALQAQKDSFKNRIGTRLIYGGIISLFPLIITQLRIQSTDPYEILDNIEGVLKQTHKEDTLYLQKLENFAYSHHKNHSKYMFTIKDDYKNIFDYYEKDLLNIQIPTSLEKAGFSTRAQQWSDRAKTGSSNKEILNGYPILRSMLNIFFNDIKKNKSLGVSETAEEIDFLIRKAFPDVHIQWLADLHVCLLYLIFSSNPKFVV